MPLDRKRHFTNDDGTNKLNSKRKTTPRAFALGAGHMDVNRIQNPREMIWDHIIDIQTNTEFSSWSSLLIALKYAEWRYQQDGSSHVCVIDTDKVRNPTYSVSDLLHISVDEEREEEDRHQPLSYEYLCHGVVEGPESVAHEWATIRELVFLTYPEIRDISEAWSQSVRVAYFPPSGTYTPPRTGEIRLFKEIAQPYGKPQLVLPITVHLFRICRRWPNDTPTRALSQDEDFCKLARKFISLMHPLSIHERGRLLDDFHLNSDYQEMEQTKIMV
jgi:hypothetical protein